MSLDKHVCICEEGCVINSTQMVFVVRGDKTSYSLENPDNKQVSKYIVDDCLLANFQNDKRCDYLFTVKNEEKKDAYFIELKGSDVPRAIEQLTASIAQLKNSINGALFGRIICSRFPKAPDTKSSHPYLRLMKMLAGNLIIRSQQLTESV